MFSINWVNDIMASNSSLLTFSYFPVFFTGHKLQVLITSSANCLVFSPVLSLSHFILLPSSVLATWKSSIDCDCVKCPSLNSLQRWITVSCQCLQLCSPWDTLVCAISIPQLCPQPWDVQDWQITAPSSEQGALWWGLWYKEGERSSRKPAFKFFFSWCWRTNFSKVETRGNQQLNFWKKSPVMSLWLRSQ